LATNLRTSLLAASVLLSACGGAAQAPSTPATAAGSVKPATSAAPAASGSNAWDQLLADARKEEKVVAIAPPFPSLRQAYTDQFKKDTGIDLEYLGLPTTEGSARAERETTAGKPTMDAMVSGGSELTTLLPKGLLLPIAPMLVMPEVVDTSKWQDNKILYMDPDQQYMLRTASTVYGGLLVNTKLVPDGAISSWNDLLKPEWQSKIIAFNPRSPGPGAGEAANILYRLGPDFLTNLYVGQKVFYSGDERAIVEGVARGSYAIGIASAPNFIEQFKGEGFPLAKIFPPGATPYLSGGYSVVKVPKGAPHPKAAAVFVNWFAGRTAQELYGKNLMEATRRTDTDKKAVPDYIQPKPGVDYLDQYSYEWYSKYRKETLDKVAEILGR
jgi:ABC-type Fe3+ transport system substrate-binding protein